MILKWLLTASIIYIIYRFIMMAAQDNLPPDRKGRDPNNIEPNKEEYIDYEELD